MIYTVTLNPSLDYRVHLDQFLLGKTNRASNETITVGGKGINVAYVLNELGYQSQCLGFVAGFTGDYLKQYLSLKSDFISLKQGNTRINVKIKEKDETEINAQGPIVDKDAWECLKQQITTLQEGDILVLSGSIPQGLNPGAYRELMETLSHHVEVVVDATGELLLQTLAFHPMLIKPNIHELEDLFNTTITSKEALIHYASILKAKGAKNVFVSLGKDGSILLDEENHYYYQKAYKGTLVNSVGAGDSMIAGFIAGKLQGLNSQACLKLATRCGSATAFSNQLATFNEIEKLP